MTEEKPKPEWQKCPQCKGFIPKSWDNHKKCGWNVKDAPVPTGDVEVPETTDDTLNKLRPLVNGILDVLDEYEARRSKKQ